MHFSISGHLKNFPFDTQIVVATCIYCIGQKVDNLYSYLYHSIAIRMLHVIAYFWGCQNSSPQRKPKSHSLQVMTLVSKKSLTKSKNTSSLVSTLKYVFCFFWPSILSYFACRNFVSFMQLATYYAQILHAGKVYQGLVPGEFPEIPETLLPTPLIPRP